MKLRDLIDTALEMDLQVAGDQEEQAVADAIKAKADAAEVAVAATFLGGVAKKLGA